MNEQQVLLHLHLSGVSASVIHKIIRYKSAHIKWVDLYHFKQNDFIQLGIKEATAAKLVARLSSFELLEKEYALLYKHGINHCTILDDAYPNLLKHIHLAPPVLYWRGDSLQVTGKSIAIVGSRKANAYGKRVINSLVPSLVQHDVTIVSGGAIGIDAMAHQATIDAGGKTFVVFGSGLLNPSPVCNMRLFNRVVEAGGALISSFALQEKPEPYNFPARNRIISGLSNGTIIVQAAKKSGANITAQFALEQGRDVFAVPGLIDDELSAGCHALIQEGAKLIAHANDVLIEYGIQAPEQKSLFDKTKYQNGSIEDIIMRACTNPCSVDELAQSTRLQLPDLQATLFNLQLDGVLKQDFTGMWKTV